MQIIKIMLHKIFQIKLIFKIHKLNKILTNEEYEIIVYDFILINKKIKYKLNLNTIVYDKML